MARGTALMRAEWACLALLLALAQARTASHGHTQLALSKASRPKLMCLRGGAAQLQQVVTDSSMAVDISPGGVVWQQRQQQAQPPTSSVEPSVEEGAALEQGAAPAAVTAPVADAPISPEALAQAEAAAYQNAISATIWSFVATLVFGLGVILPWKGGVGCVEFFTAFLVEKSLSIDNLFVFLMIFEYFKVPEPYTQRVLKWGILSALVLRGIMIAAGVLVINRFRPVLLFFSLVLVVSAIKMLLPEEEGHDLAQNPLVKLCHSMFDSTDYYDEDKFFTLVGTKSKVTPLFIVLMIVELSDVMFAVDSIPAVVGVTQDPIIVYSSNVFALLALRSLYTVLSKSVHSLCYLKHGVALILLFIGAKMSLEYFHVHIPGWASPLVILMLLSVSSAASIHQIQQQGDPPNNDAAPEEAAGPAAESAAANAFV